jgi:CysZ protein
VSEIVPVTASVLDGPRSFFAGARFIVMRPKSWPLAIVPVLVALVVIGAVATLGLWGAFSVSHHLTDSIQGRLGAVAAVLANVVLGAVAVLVSVVVGFSLAQPLSGPALEKLSRGFEAELGAPERGDDDLLESFWRGLRVTFTALLVGMPLLGALAVVDLLLPIAVVVTIPLKILITALMVAWDLLDYPFSLRKMRVRERLAWVRANLRAVVTFGALGALGLMVPFVGLLVLPIGVAGATHLVLAREGLPPKP